MNRGFRSSFHLALKRIGRQNGHAPQAGGHNIDPLLHYLMVDSEARSFFDAQRKTSLNDLLAAMPDEATERVDDLVATAKKEKMKQSTVALVDTGRYVLNFDVKKPASRVDTVKLRNRLARDDRYTAEELDDLFNECTKDNEPAKSFVVSPLFD